MLRMAFPDLALGFLGEAGEGQDMRGEDGINPTSRTAATPDDVGDIDHIDQRRLHPAELLGLKNAEEARPMECLDQFRRDLTRGIGGDLEFAGLTGKCLGRCDD